MSRHMKIVSLLFAIGATIVVAVASSLLVRAERLTYTPFTATVMRTRPRVEVPAGATPAADWFHRNTVTVGVRSDGSKVTQEFLHDPSGAVTERRLIRDYEKGERVSLDGMTRSKSTMVIPHTGTHPRKVDCSGGAVAERKEILGYQAIKHVNDSPPGSDLDVYFVEWLAPGLNCFSLLSESFIRTASGDQPGQRSEVVRVVPGEPERSLFDIPVDFVERKPSAVLREYETKFPGQISPTTLWNAERILDKVYRQEPQ